MQWVKKLSLQILIAALVAWAPSAWGGSVDRFLGPKAWQCTFSAELKSDITEKTGPGGMAYGPKRQLFQALGKTGVKAESPGGDTDSYREIKEQSVRGQVRLHHVYDGGPDGIQIAGWNNGGAEVHIRNVFEGTEQNKTIHRVKTTTYEGSAKFEEGEYEPPFQIWIYPDQGTYSLDYGLSPVKGQQIEHCRMKGEMEEGRKKAEKATDADMPLGGMLSGLIRLTCPTETKRVVEIDGGVLSGAVDNIPLPASGLTLEGKGRDQYSGSMVSWLCKPE